MKVIVIIVDNVFIILCRNTPSLKIPLLPQWTRVRNFFSRYPEAIMEGVKKPDCNKVSLLKNLILKVGFTHFNLRCSWWLRRLVDAMEALKYELWVEQPVESLVSASVSYQK